MGTRSTLFVFIFLSPFILTGTSGTSPIIEDCLCSKPRCPENEEYRCRNWCPPETCITLYAAFDCVAHQTCKPGCYCKKGFLRKTTNGTCVTPDQCLPLGCVNDPNAKKGCGNRCGKTCEDYNDKNKVCPPTACRKNGCECKNGFVYDSNLGLCVKPHKCTKQCTKPHERYSSCSQGECGPKTCNDLGKPLACPGIAGRCYGECICEQGYVRNAKGNCVNAKACPNCGGDPNAESGCGNPCGKTCDSLNKTDLVCPQYCEDNGCDCKKGFALNTATKKCIPIKDCPKPPPVCPKNEEPGCRQPCPPETCITRYVAIDCIAGQTCVEGCYCKQGYLRTGPNGTCIPENDCLPLECANDPNAKKGCGNRCGKTCEDYNNKGKKICPKGPCTKDGCECKDGYIYDRNIEKCVRPDECTKQCTKPNERYTSCLLGECVPKTCDQLGKPVPCPAIAEPCAGGCICKEGYVRDSKGNCIDKKKCRSCGGDPNAVSGCGNPCGKTCDSLNGPNKTVCPKYCDFNGCDCKEGFLLNKATNKCTPIKDCPKRTPPRVCPANEQPGCRNSCPPETCFTLYAAFRCVSNQTCVQGCFCKPGYLRTSVNGTCIPKDECLPLECLYDPNAQRGCGIRCGKTCTDYNENKICPLGPCKLNGCDCKNGFVYDNSTKLCVKPRQCTKQCTKPHERYSKCLLGECVPKTCDELGKPLACPAIAEPCEGGCICEKGYVRDCKGNCIDKTTCPNQCTKPHEQYTSCLLGECRPKTCNDLGKPLPCPGIVPPCAGGCICQKGFVRDSKGNCIDEKTCPKQCSKNEEIYCGPSCPEASCEKPKPPICINKKCELKCFCKKGFVRDANNKCIPANTCPVVCNKPHERYIDCLDGQCNPKTCDDLGRSISCPFIRGPCPGGCMCVKDYLRAANGTCIKQELCPPKPCGTNETWVTSCNGFCPDSFCPRNDKPLPPCEPLLPCYPGCQCKLNYRLNATRSCILAPDCPAINCTRQNEVFDSCPSTCLAENCEDINNQPTTCNTLIWLCSPRCVCAKGYFRNKDGLCVPASQCPKACPNPNEKYIDCLAGQCYPKTCDELINPAPCPSVRHRHPCPGGCICIDGYVRNAKGVCIKKEACPPACSDSNDLVEE